MVKNCVFNGVMVVSLVSLVAVGDRAIAQSPEPPPPPEPGSPYLRPQTACPTDLETLTAGLIRDLPSYANRVASSSLGVNETGTGFGTVLVAGRAEFEPIDLEPLTFSQFPEPSDTIRQVFLTTLERQYTENAAVTLENYHWLFLALGDDGWRLALIFSRIAVDEAGARPPTPPREVSDGITGQAVQLWLRDCRAGAVYPIEPPATTEP